MDWQAEHAQREQERMRWERQVRIDLEQRESVRVANDGGRSLIEHRQNSMGGYLKFQKPLIAEWEDVNVPTSARYFAFSFSPDFRNAIVDAVHAEFNGGVSSLSNVLPAMTKLLELFEPGDYQIDYSPVASDMGRVLPLYDQVERPSIDDRHPGAWNHYSYGPELLFTQPYNMIDPGRVKFYEDQIEKGVRPTLLVYTSAVWSRDYDEDGDWFARFILDGHHKSLAYQSTEQTPSVVTIRRVYSSEDQLNFSRSDFDADLANRLSLKDVDYFLTAADGGFGQGRTHWV